MSIKAELSYLEFHNTRDKLGSGFYRIIEADGDVSIAKVVQWSDGRIPTVTWLTEDEYAHSSHDEFNRIQPEDLAEAEYDLNHNSEVFDQLVYGIDPDDNQMASQDNRSGDEAKVTSSLADLLREAMSIDPRGMTDEQYAEHCELAAQDKRDGMHL